MKTITIKLEVEVDEAHFDSGTLAWVEELMDKAREQGDVTLCQVVGISPVLTLCRK
jgi:hypothetical protein